MDEQVQKPIVTHLLSPADVLGRLVLLFPDFRQQWDAPDNCFVPDDGVFSYCGVFAEFSGFFRDRFESLPQPALNDFGRFISECVGCRSSELNEAAATCFLENMTHERFSARLKAYLHGEALQFYSQFDAPA